MTDEALQREYEQIGLRIRNARVDRKMSQAELAAKANISLPHISSIELGKTKMLLSTFTRVIEALQVSADSILRANVPTVTSMYASEIAELFEDCTPSELESLKAIVKNLKATMKNNQTNQYMQKRIGMIRFFFCKIDHLMNRR